MLPGVGDKNPQISLLQGVILSQSTFHLAVVVFFLVCAFVYLYYTI